MTTANPSEDADAIAALDTLFQRWNRSDAPGAIVGVAHRGVPIYRRGFGLASIEHGTANTPRTRMRIGSTSKHFASLAALLLAEDGKLDIDAPLRTYLPELSGIAGTPTLRQLMQHSGGLRDPYDLPGVLMCGRYLTSMPAGTCLELSQRFTGENFAPGERMIYCNNGYHLLSLVVERIGGLPFAEFLRERIFVPLALHDTMLLESDMTIVPNIATFHQPQADGGWRRGIYPVEELLGSGGMVSTIDDMLRWLAHLRGDKKVGSAQTWRQMLERARYSSGASGDYGLGLTRETYRGVEIIHHAGAVLGCTCQMLTVPAHELDIIVIFNRMDGPAPATALKIVDAVLANAGLSEPPAPVGSEGRDALLGYWHSATSQRLFGIAMQTLPERAPGLALSIHGQVAGMLEATADGLRMVSPAHGTVEVCEPAAGTERPQQLDFIDSGHRERFTRLPDARPDPATLAAALVGRYHYAEFDREFDIVFDDGALYLDLRPSYGQSRLKLDPLSDDVCLYTLTGNFPVAVPTTGSLTVARDGPRVTGLWLNVMRTRNLWLERR